MLSIMVWRNFNTLLRKDVFKEVTNNSAQNVAALNTMNNLMGTLVSKFDNLPAASPAPPPASANASTPTSETLAATVRTPVREPDTPTTKAKNVNRKVKRAKLFACSLGLGCDVRKIENDLNCTIEVIETFHIIKNPSAPDPEKFLKNMFEKNNFDDVNFIIISVGTNDITRMKIERNIVDLNF